MEGVQDIRKCFSNGAGIYARPSLESGQKVKRWRPREKNKQRLQTQEKSDTSWGAGGAQGQGVWTDSKEELEMSRFYPPENRAQLGRSEQEHHRHGSFLEKDACGYCREEGLDKNQNG